jgi:hypothetical protein
VFWQLFIAADMLAVGYITTFLHWPFVALQLVAAASKADRLDAVHLMQPHASPAGNGSIA